MKDNQGYSIRYALFQNSRGIDPEKAGGRSSWTSAYRAAARDPAAIGIGNAPLMGPLNASRRDPESHCGDKMSGGTVTRSSQGYGFPRDSNIKRQASSPKQQASSLKPQASSSMILEPRKSFTVPEPRCSSMINVLLGCLTWKLIWWGEKRTLLPFVTLSSTVKKWPEVL